MHYLRGLGKCCVGVPYLHKGLKVGRGVVGGGWFVKMVWWVGGWCVVSIGKVVENGVVVVCEKTNGRCKLQSSMKHDKLGDMGKEVYY